MPWSVAGAAIGAIGSMSAADAQSEAADKAKNPWSGAEPWIRSNIAQGQDLQDYYTKNPFNSIQQQGMQGMLDNYDYQNKTVIPGLMNFSNGLMNSNYQRAPSRGASEGQLAGLLSANGVRGQGPSGGRQPPGLMTAQQPMGQAPEMYTQAPSPAQMPVQQPMGQAPEMYTQAPSPAQMPVQQPQGQQQMPQGQPQGQPMQQGPFSMPPSQAGAQPVNWNAMNPLYKAPVDPAEAPKPYVPTDQEVFRQNFGDAMFPESENKQQFGVNGPSLEEQYWRNKLGRPSKYINVEG